MSVYVGSGGNNVIGEFLVSIVDRLDSMDQTAKESPTLTKYMYSEGSREAIIDTLPMRLKRVSKEQTELWPMEDGIHEDGTRVLGSDNAEFKKHREILRKMVEYFSPENYTSNSGVPTSSLTVLMRGSRLHQIAVRRSIWRVQEEIAQFSSSDTSGEGQDEPREVELESNNNIAQINPDVVNQVEGRNSEGLQAINAEKVQESTDVLEKGVVEKLSEEIGVMGENVRLQSLQVKSLEYVLERALEKIDRKIETLCKVQFEVLEKITGLKSVENEIKALSDSVGGLENLKIEKPDLVGVSTQTPGQLPGQSPTPDSCKGKIPAGEKSEKKPLQRTDEEKVRVPV